MVFTVRRAGTRPVRVKGLIPALLVFLLGTKATTRRGRFVLRVIGKAK